MSMKILNTKKMSWSLTHLLFIIIIIIIIIIIKAWYSYYISNKFHLEECDKKEHVKVTVAATTPCWNRTL